MVLRRFATDDERIVMVGRSDGRRIPTKVKTACAETGFYEIAVEDVAEEIRGDHDIEVAEKAYAEIEGRAKPLLDRLASQALPSNVEDKLRLAVCFALQMTRDWSHREHLDESKNAMLPHYLDFVLTDDRVRAHLRERGKPHDAQAIADMRARIHASPPTVTTNQSHAVQMSVDNAINECLGHLTRRSWRLLTFDEPCLLTSDHPFGYWSPPGGLSPPFGVGNAPVIYYPVDRQTALAMHAQHVPSRVVRSGSTRSQYINTAVATEASKWIFHHPDDNPLDDMEIPPKAVLVDEIVGERVDDDGNVRELHRLEWRVPDSV